jgi:hypothetical protein
MYKGWEGTNVKARYEFNDDPIKMCFQCKIKMDVDYKIKNINFFLLPNWFHPQSS